MGPADDDFVGRCAEDRGSPLLGRFHSAPGRPGTKNRQPAPRYELGKTVARAETLAELHVSRRQRSS
ncbi:hypothetical protein FGD71_008360 [Streptomyces sporangiiformans]|uniref:Uncharacterized protein n=1 Tax=Streptomyces sporangiiformans TaxID=2315329 RepID=A0A505DDH3_9ACTN|nr:hypothetical protein FGD71_008360 [Streptomyces sporangiiformans]